MVDDRVRSTKLKFKGEKSRKKRKRQDDDLDEGRSSKRREEDKDPDTWVLPEQANEIRGPTFIFHPSDPSPISINFNSTTNRIVLHSMDKSKNEDDSAPSALLEQTPSDVAQVWVTTRVAGSPTINLRTGTGEGKFLSCDKYGLVSADRDARGPQEEWTPVILPDGMVAFMNVYEKYLSVDEIAGGSVQLRGDSDEVGFRERFWVKIQNKYKKEAHEEERKRKEVTAPPKIDEASTNQLYQTWGAGKVILSKEDKKELKEARKEGRLAEALLDRRAKLKRPALHRAYMRWPQGEEYSGGMTHDEAGKAKLLASALKYNSVTVHPLQYFMPINKPKPVLTILRVYHIDESLLAHTHSKADLIYFKYLVRVAYQKYLDPSRDYRHQRREKRHKFKEYVLQNDLKLYQYSDQWPIDSYSEIWGRYVSRLARTSESTTESQDVSVRHSRNFSSSTRKPRVRGMSRAVASPFSGPSNHPTTPKSRIIVYIGRPPSMAAGATSTTPEKSILTTGTERTSENLGPAQKPRIITFIGGPPPPVADAVTPASEEFPLTMRRTELTDANRNWPVNKTQFQSMNAAEFLLHLRLAMGLNSNDVLFMRMIELAHKHGSVFLKEYKPCDQASSQRLSNAVDSVLEEEPDLRYYEDAWPIRFFLRRCAESPDRQIGWVGFDSELKASGLPIPRQEQSIEGHEAPFTNNGMSECATPRSALNSFTSKE